MPSNTTYVLNSNSNWPTFHNITVAAGTPNGGLNQCLATTDLQIVTGAVGTTTVVQMNTLVMNTCSRLIIIGGGNIDLRIGAATGPGVTLGTAGAPTLIRFGATSADSWTPNVRTPINPSQLTVSVNSNSTTNPFAVGIWGVDYVYANFLVPNGEFYDDSGSTSMTATLLSGNINAKLIDVESSGTYQSIPGGGASTGYTLFTNLRSWKDQ